MVIAGETSGDLLASELVGRIRAELNRQPCAFTWDYQPLQTSLAPRFFGAGGPQMAAAGVELAFDMTAHSVTGLSEVLKNYGKFRRLFKQLYRLALQREPDAIICVDFSGFNRRFAHAIRKFTRSRAGWFHDWRPRIIQYVSPQVWASREKSVSDGWGFRPGAEHFPVRAAVVRGTSPKVASGICRTLDRRSVWFRPAAVPNATPADSALNVLLLPGSRPGELTRHLPVFVDSLNRIRADLPQVHSRMVLPNAGLLELARNLGLPESLRGPGRRSSSRLARRRSRLGIYRDRDR